MQDACACGWHSSDEKYNDERWHYGPAQDGHVQIADADNLPCCMHQGLHSQLLMQPSRCKQMLQHNILCHHLPDLPALTMSEPIV